MAVTDDLHLYLVDHEPPAEAPDLDAIDLDDDTAEAPEPWRISDDGEATWALRKLAQYDAEITRLDALADAEITRIRLWLGRAKRSHERRREFFEASLIDYRRRLEADRDDLPNVYELPAGKLSRRKLPDKVEVVDEGAFIDWATEHLPGCVKRSALVAPLKAKGSGFKLVLPDDPDETTGHVFDPADGAAVPGVQVVRGEHRYTVTPDTGGVA